MIMLLLVLFHIALTKNLRNNLLVGQNKVSNHLSTKNDINIIYVHLVPHSHDDVGWLKTYEQYYYGLNNKVQWAGIQYTIDSVIRSLFFDSSKKFIQVEIAYFKMWWDEQNDEVKNKTRFLIKNGQLEFINGGWCMNDEATAYYEDIFDQMTLGHKFLLETFNVQPTIGWQIDPFGHTSTQALFSHLMGFNGWFFSRIDYQDMQLRRQNQQMEMIMLPSDYPIFTHVTYNHYESPPQFSFDTINSAESIVDNPNSQLYNVDKRAQVLVDYFKEQAKVYKGNILMHTLGSDFAWSNAPMYYKNIDRLINYINSNKEFNMHIFYSTPSEYLQSINYEGLQYPNKTDDFLPYADRLNGYWTGYFTSRVSFKLLIKQYGRQAQIMRKLVGILMMNGKTQYIQLNKNKILNQFNRLDEALATNQHHDAVTGTAKQFVTNDYINMLCQGMFKVNQEMNYILQELALFETQESQSEQFIQCNYNQTAQNCSYVYEQLIENKTIQINIVDTRDYQYIDYMRIKVPNMSLIIFDQFNNEIQGDIMCIDPDNPSNCDLYFIYQRNPKTILQYFKITPTNNPSAYIIQQEYDPFTNPNTLNYTSDSLISLNDSKQFQLNYHYYESSEDRQQSSGAYIFRPKIHDQEPSQFGDIKASQLYKGQIVHIITIQRDLIETQIKKFIHMNDTYEIETYVTELPVDDKTGKELVMRIKTDIHNGDTFHTDSSGLHMQKRRLNYRETWNLTVHQAISGNYYPINGAILIEDTNNSDSVALINDRSQGGSSLKEGELEIMIHRRTLRDDARGVGEPLNERNEDKTGLDQQFNHILSFFNKKESPSQHRFYQYISDTKPLVYYSRSTAFKFTNKQQSFKITYSRDLDKLFTPQPLTKYYFQVWNQDQYLYRIHNMNEDVNITIPQVESLVLEETTLTGNQLWSEWQKNRLRWTLEGGISEPEVVHDNNIKPQQIRTFLVHK